MPGQDPATPASRQLQENLQHAIAQLEGLIDNTENYYGVIHESLPFIDRNLELTGQETNMLINYFIDSPRSGDSKETGEGQFLMAETLERIEANFKTISSYLLKRQEIDRLLEVFLDSGSEGVSFESFLNLVGETKKVLSDVGDISINAIIFSARLGDAGRGFGVISDYILQASTSLENELVEIDTLLNELLQWHHSLQSSIGTIDETQKKAENEYIRDLDKVFARVTESMRAISDILRNLVNNVHDTVSPFQELMALIQRQDIVRQNMENTIKCLHSVEEKYLKYLTLKEDQNNREAALNHIFFTTRALGLVQTLADNMAADLTKSLQDIMDTTSSLLAALEEVRDESGQLSRFLAGGQKEGQGNPDQGSSSAVDYSFHTIFNFMQELMAVLVEIKKQMETLSSDKKTFDKSMRRTELSMNNIAEQVAHLNKVKLLARIELARVGLQDNAMGEKIENVVAAIGNTLTENIKVFQDLKRSLSRDLQSFDRIIKDNQRKIDLAVTEADNSMERLRTTNEIVSQAIVALNREVENLHHEVASIFQRLQDAKPLEDSVHGLNQFIQNLLETAEAEKKLIMDRFELNSWEDSNDELESLFNYLTGYLERVKARDYMETEHLDAGSEEGDLTLF